MRWRFVTMFCAALAAGPAGARTPLDEAALALINSKPELRFTVYGETDLAPVRIFRDEKRTYIELPQRPNQRVDALEVTPVGYRRLPTAFESPYLVVGGFAPSMAISYPGRKLLFIEFGAETVRQPVSDAELAIRVRERATALLDQQTKVEAQQRAIGDLEEAEKQRTAERVRLAQQQEAKAREEQAKAQRAARDAEERQARAAAEEARIQSEPRRVEPRRAEVEQQAEQQASRAFMVYRKDKNLKGVLARWAGNEGLELQWSATDDEAHNPDVSSEGPVKAASFKDAVQTLLEAFRTKDLKLTAVFYSDGTVDITEDKGAQ